MFWCLIQRPEARFRALLGGLLLGLHRGDDFFAPFQLFLQLVDGFGELITLAFHIRKAVLRNLIGARQLGHLLVTDVVLPDVSGLDVADRLRAERPSMQVMYVSGYAPANGQTGPLTGARFLQKPVRRKDLLRAARLLLDEPSSVSTRPALH